MPLPLIYFCKTVTRGTTASAGIFLTVLSMSSMSALSSTESNILGSLLCNPCASNWASVSVRGVVVVEGVEGSVDNREIRSFGHYSIIKENILHRLPPQEDCHHLPFPPSFSPSLY